MEIINQINSQDWLNIAAIIITGIVILAVLRIVVNVAQSVMRMGCFLLVIGVAIYAMIYVLPRLSF